MANQFAGKAASELPALKPYRGKPAVRNFRGGNGNVGIIRSPVRAVALPDIVDLATGRATRGIEVCPTGRDFQRQRRRNPMRRQRRKVSGLTFTKALRQENMRSRIAIISRVESCARRRFTFRS